MLILYQKVRFPLTRSSFSFSFWKHFFIRFSSSKTYTVNEFNYFLSDFCPTVLKVKRIKDCDSIIYPLFSCGGLTRTDDLWVMSPTSYHCSTPRCSCDHFWFRVQRYDLFLIKQIFRQFSSFWEGKSYSWNNCPEISSALLENDWFISLL